MHSNENTFQENLREIARQNAEQLWMSEVTKNGQASAILYYENDTREINGEPVYMLNADPMKQFLGTATLSKEAQVGKTLLDQKQKAIDEAVNRIH